MYLKIALCVKFNHQPIGAELIDCKCRHAPAIPHVYRVQLHDHHQSQSPLMMMKTKEN